MHLILLAEGMPEGIARFEAEMDQHSYGKGVCRLRQVKLYDLQFPKEAYADVMKNFPSSIKRGKQRKPKAYHLKYKDNPFKFLRLRQLIYYGMRLFGGLLGMKAVPPMDPDKQSDPGPGAVKMQTMNYIPIAVLEDNVMVNLAHGREEEWL